MEKHDRLALHEKWNTDTAFFIVLVSFEPVTYTHFALTQPQNSNTQNEYNPQSNLTLDIYFQISTVVFFIKGH